MTVCGGSVSSAPSSNRACGSPAHGSRSSLDQRHARHCRLALWGSRSRTYRSRGRLFGPDGQWRRASVRFRPGTTKAPSLGGRCPASPLRWASPTPRAARRVFEGSPLMRVACGGQPRTVRGLSSCACLRSRRAVPTTPPKPTDFLWPVAWTIPLGDSLRPMHKGSALGIISRLL